MSMDFGTDVAIRDNLVAVSCDVLSTASFHLTIVDWRRGLTTSFDTTVDDVRHILPFDHIQLLKSC